MIDLHDQFPKCIVQSNFCIRSEVLIELDSKLITYWVREDVNAIVCDLIYSSKRYIFCYCIATTIVGDN